MGQFFHLAIDLTQYVLTCFSPPKPSHPPKSKIIVAWVVIDPQMAAILVRVGKNLVEDVLLDGGSGINIITKDL
jgi:hypothetical protein